MENNELKDLDLDREEKESIASGMEEETNFGGDEEEEFHDSLDETSEEFNFRFNRVRDKDEKREKGGIKRSETAFLKQFIKDITGLKINKKDGPNSKLLFDLFEPRFGKQNNLIGVSFDGKPIFKFEGGKMVESKNKTNKKTITKFNEIVEKAKKEHEKTADNQIDEQIEMQILNDKTFTSMVTASETEDKIVSQLKETTLDRMSDLISEKSDEIIESKLLTKQEIREIRGILYPTGELPIDKLNALDIEKKYWENEAGKAYRKGDNNRAEICKIIIEISELKSDEIRLRVNQRLQSDESINILEDELYKNDLNQFEKFKRWAKNNLLGLSGVAIAIAGIITSIIVAARPVVKAGAKATFSFGKILAKIAKDLGPIGSTILNFASSFLKFGAKGIGFLANNLWILVLAFTWFVYDFLKNKKQKR